jgi:hypothetical protein
MTAAVNVEDSCGKCGMKLTGDCCKDEFKIVKISDSHKLITNDIKIASPVAVIHHSNIIFETGLISSNYRSGYNSHSPPDLPKISLNILNCVFRI